MIQTLDNQKRACELCWKDKTETVWIKSVIRIYPEGIIICKDCLNDAIKMFDKSIAEVE